MNTVQSMQEILGYLPQKLREFLSGLPEEEFAQIQEIRMRNQKPAGIVRNGKETSVGTVIIRSDDLIRTFQAVCSYSVYSYEQQIAEGYITIKGGCRVGICGSAVRDGQSVKSLKYISSLNFRIAGEQIGIAETLWKQTDGSILLTGSAGSGKTTYLRDLCRLAGTYHRTALIDERGELASVQRGTASHDVGIMTDIFDGYPRSDGILTALRVMTPEYIICDELSTPDDVQAVLQAHGCGIRFMASCHAGTPEDFRKRPFLKPLLEAGVFQYAVFLQNGIIHNIRRIT
ncbi:MAG: Flp pilus assembly complex ATPase component TadA [Oscillospiraceae bacterium]|nr:Flp pilus assembly complex ATPase component TadA [Oscillospiraceae bacterium]